MQNQIFIDKYLRIWNNFCTFAAFFVLSLRKESVVETVLVTKIGT